MYRCMYCSTERSPEELQTIESIFSDFDPEEVSKLIGRETTATTGSDTTTVCKGACAELYRENSDVILRDEEFKP
jgi:hypothetical protein